MRYSLAAASGALFVVVSIGVARAEEPSVLHDLGNLSPVTLDKAELQRLLPGAKMGRTTAAGKNQFWSNQEDGTLIASSESHSAVGGTRRGGAHGKWSISDDGRYCVEIQWAGAPTESWCRHVIRTSAGYFLTGLATSPNAKVFRMEIGAK